MTICKPTYNHLILALGQRISLIAVSILFIGAVYSAKAQSSAVEDSIVSIKNTPSFIYAKVKDGDKKAASDKANDKLIEMVRRQFATILPIEPENDKGSQNSIKKRVLLFKSPLQYKSFSWKSWGTQHVFAYIDLYDAKRYMIDEATKFIRNTDNITFADATGKDEQQALNNARANLITQFYVRVKSQEESRFSEVNGEADQSFSSQVKATSQLSMIGLKTRTYRLVDDWYAIAYITDEDKEASFKAAKDKIYTVVKEGDKQWTRGNYSRAVNAFYRAYILSDIYFKPLPYSFMSGDSTSNLKSSLRFRIEEFFQTVDVVTQPAFQLSESDTRVPFTIYKEKAPVNRVLYQYKVQNSNQVDRIDYGKGKLDFSNYMPAQRKVIIPVKFMPDISEELKSDAILRELEKENRFFVEKPVEVDFSNVFKVTIKAYFDGPEVTYSLETSNLFVTTAKWDFGDGNTKIEQNPVHKYQNFDEKKVSVVVNGDTNLTDTKYVYLQKGILTNSPINQKTQEIASNNTERKNNSKTTVEPKKEKRLTYRDFLNPHYEKLMEYKTYEGLIKTLKRYRSNNELDFGNQQDLINSEGAMVAIVNPESKMVEDHLIFYNNRYIKVSTGEELTRLNEHYSGNYQIWVQAN